MERDYVIQMANTIREQLIAMTPVSVILSWGMETFVAIEFNGMAALRFHVNGRLFRGNVIVAYNTMDYYEVYLQDCSGVKCIHEEVYFDRLGKVIDEAVEQGKDKAEYKRFLTEKGYPTIAG